MTSAERLERQVSRRAAYIETTTELSATEAEALACSELGFSSSGIAKWIDSTQGTAKTYLGRVIARFGPEAAYVRLEFDIERDLDPVEVDDIADWTGAAAEWDEHDEDAGRRLKGSVWRAEAKRHPEYVPEDVRLVAGITADDGGGR
jgi:hypothetical protein